MDDPVVAADGHTYERTMVSEWFRRGHMTSPLTGAKLPSTTLITNHTLRCFIKEFRERHPYFQGCPSKVRALRLKLEEAEAHTERLSEKHAFVALKQEIEALRKNNALLESQVVSLETQLAESTTVRSGVQYDSDDESFGFPSDTEFYSDTDFHDDDVL